jgi:methylmalonyl-CoA/ethylmalonyl-CoA epimerase
MLKKLSHFGIAVKDLNKAVEYFSKKLGLTLKAKEELPEIKTNIAILEADQAEIELLTSSDTSSPIGKFLSKRGEGIHHICFEVDNIYQEIKDLKQKGILFVTDTPQKGASESLVIFIHPRGSHGVLIELKQRRKEGQ